MKLEEYSDKAFVVRGEYTKKYINELKYMNGRFNTNLKGGSGWIFSKRHKDKLNTFIEQKNKECGQIFFDQKESGNEEKIKLNHIFEIERKHLEKEKIALGIERKNDILKLDDTLYDIEFDTMENKRIAQFNKVNKCILKGSRILKLTLIFFCVFYIFNNIRDDIYDYLDMSVNTKYIYISHI